MNINRRDFIKQFAALLSLPFLGKESKPLGGLLSPKENEKMTVGGWVFHDDMWGYNIVHTTTPGYWYNALFDGQPSALMFISKKLTDDQIRALYLKTKSLFGDEVDESIEAYL